MVVSATRIPERAMRLATVRSCWLREMVSTVPGEVFYGVELIVASDDSNADGIDVWIKQIGAVAGGVHPEVVDDDGGWGLPYVFCDEPEVRASIGSASCQFGFAVELMGYFLVIRHLASVNGGGFGEGPDRSEVAEVLDWRGLRSQRRRDIARLQ